MDNIGFFVPLSYTDRNKSFSNSLEEAADDYFFYGGMKDRAYVIDTEKGTHQVQLIKCKANVGLTALKIASLLLLPIPLFMLIVKAVARRNRKYAILNPNSGARTESFVPLLQKPRVSVYNAAMEERYKKIFEKAGIDYSQATPLQLHAIFFANDHGEITRTSIQNAFNRLHFSKPVSVVIGFIAIKALGPIMGEKNGALSLKDLNKAKHSSDTGVFTSQGKFDPEKFDEIQEKYAKQNKNFITADELAKMRAANKARDSKNKDAGFGATASKGEFGTLLSLFSDGALVDINGNIIPTITFKRLREFYTAGPKLFEEAAAGQ